jgi:hypothetical protein
MRGVDRVRVEKSSIVIEDAGTGKRLKLDAADAASLL